MHLIMLLSSSMICKEFWEGRSSLNVDGFEVDFWCNYRQQIYHREKTDGINCVHLRGIQWSHNFHYCSYSEWAQCCWCHEENSTKCCTKRNTAHSSRVASTWEIFHRDTIFLRQLPGEVSMPLNWSVEQSRGLSMMISRAWMYMHIVFRPVLRNHSSLASAHFRRIISFGFRSVLCVSLVRIYALF
jgi:hypothetical protein